MNDAGLSTLRCRPRNRLRVFVAILVAMGASSAPSFGQDAAELGGPVYDPASKSYFELVNVNGGEKIFSGIRTYAVGWETAKKLAEDRAYKGVHGHLAVIRTPETHFFLMKTFRTRDVDVAWIGLRYLCRTRQLEWVDGQIQAPTDFQAWDSTWDHAIPGAGCTGTDPREYPYMPVAEGMASYGFQWFAQGIAKQYSYYFVQYPTGKP